MPGNWFAMAVLSIFSLIVGVMTWAWWSRFTLKLLFAGNLFSFSLMAVLLVFAVSACLACFIVYAMIAKKCYEEEAESAIEDVETIEVSDEKLGELLIVEWSKAQSTGLTLAFVDKEGNVVRKIERGS